MMTDDCSQVVRVCRGLDRTPFTGTPDCVTAFENQISRVEKQVRGSNPPPVALAGTV